MDGIIIFVVGFMVGGMAGFMLAALVAIAHDKEDENGKR